MPPLSSSRAPVAWIQKATFIAFTFGIVALSAAGTARAQVCAFPESAGDSTISGTVNTCWTPGVGSYGGSIPLGNQRGTSAALAEGDLVVIQMQCAGIDSSDSLGYSHNLSASYGTPTGCRANTKSTCFPGKKPTCNF